MNSKNILMYKTRCPKCAEQGKDNNRDNLAVYSDGHSFCFSCGYYTSPNFKERIKNNIPGIKEPLVLLPEDISTEIDSRGSEWLKQYNLSTDNFTLYWSVIKQSLYFKVDENVYIARYFGNNPKHPKWITYGINNSYIKFFKPNTTSTTCVLVEDLISGYKVGKIEHCSVLFNAHVSNKRLALLALLGYTKIIFWLDPDKYKEKIAFAKNASILGFQAKVIQTEKDPKYYDYKEITKYLYT